MRRPLTSFPATAAAFLISACTPPASTVPTVTIPGPRDAPDSGVATETVHLRLTGGQFKYHLVQNTTIRSDASDDTATGMISTTARLSVDVSANPDSSYQILVSVDSLQIVTEGAVPSRSVVGLLSLGAVLRASLGKNRTIVESTLPDSLCAYSQFATAARELFLPQLPPEISSPLDGIQVDTATTTACRAGTRISMVSRREARDLRTDPPQFALEARTDLAGTGVLGRDTVIVSGSVTTRGTAWFTRGSRLPSLLKTESEGIIRVNLGSSTRLFRQSSTLQIEEEQGFPPN
jgi:hypothetical protein